MRIVLNHDLCSIVYFSSSFDSVTLAWGLLRGAAEREKLVAAAALIEIKFLPFVEKVLTVFLIFGD